MFNKIYYQSKFNIYRKGFKMKVIKAFGPQDLRVVDVPVPEPGPGYVRIRVRASGICGSDKGIWYTKNKSDFVAGHEAAGDVDKLGEGVASLEPGDRVMINNVVGCGKCAACRMGAFTQCPSWDGSMDVNNGFGEYLVAPARNCLRILPGLDYIDGALIMDNWGTPFGGLMRANLRPGSGTTGAGAHGASTRSAGAAGVDMRGTDVLVNGCGPLGQAAIGLSSAMGAYVIAVDPIGWRRDLALKNGAHLAIKPDDLPNAARMVTDGFGVHLAMECSGKGAAYENCLKSLRIGGDLVSIGENAEFTFNSSPQIIRRMLSITGTWYSTLPQAREVMQLALQNRINVRSFLSRTITLDQVPELFGSIVDCADGILKCVIVFE